MTDSNVEPESDSLRKDTDNPSSGQSPSGQRRNKARRDILRTLVVGGGAMTAARATPESWVKPVVESVILPGHAATSAPAAGGGGVNPFGVFNSGVVGITEAAPPAETRLADATPQESETISDELLEFFMPSAQAQQEIPICNIACDVEFNATVQNVVSYICVSGSGIFDFFKVPVYPDSPPTMGPTHGGSAFLFNGGEFRNGKWHINVNYLYSVSNTSIDVTLSPGGIGCEPDR